MISSTRHILLIEDDHNLGMLLEHMLSRNFQVSKFGDGYSALNWMASGNLPDLIMTDVDIAGMGSAVLLDNLRVSGFYRNIPVIIMSGKADAEKAERLLTHGASAVLTKPFARDELFRLIRKLAP